MREGGKQNPKISEDASTMPALKCVHVRGRETWGGSGRGGGRGRGEEREREREREREGERARERGEGEGEVDGEGDAEGEGESEGEGERRTWNIVKMLALNVPKYTCQKVRGKKEKKEKR